MRDYRPGSAGGRRSSFQNLPAPWQLRVFSASAPAPLLGHLPTDGDAAHDQRSRRRPSHCTQSQARAARRRSVRCGYRDAAYYTHTHVHTPPTSVSVGAYESDNESDDAVDDQKGRRRQPESDEARAVHTLRCLYRGSEGAPPSRAQVQRPKKKDLSYCSLNIRGRAPPHGPRSSRGGGRLPS